jgi:hypothetical protein
MKKLMMIAAMMVATLTVSAQQESGTFSIIPKAGFNLSNLAGDVSGNSIKIGLVAGAEGMYQINPLIGVSAGVLYSMQGCEGENDAKANYNFINIPLLANFYVARNFALKIGLQPAFVVSAKTKYDKVEYDVKDAMQSITLDIPIGASYEISNFVIDARYNLGIAKINKKDGSIRNSVIQFTVGYKFPL